MPFAEICEPISHIGEGIVCGNGFHSLFEKFSEQTGNAGVAAGGFDTCPAGDIFFQGDGDIAEAVSR